LVHALAGLALVSLWQAFWRQTGILVVASFTNGMPLFAGCVGYQCAAAGAAAIDAGLSPSVMAGCLGSQSLRMGNAE